jgi:hypothetical protein
VVAKAFGVHAPAPGIMTYSKIEQKWNDVFVIFESSKALFGKELNKSDGLSLKSQLESGDVSRLVGSLFEEATKEKLDGRATLIECQSGGTVDYGVWYLCIDGSSKMYYYYLYSVAGKYKVIIGCISTPPYLPDSCFDGITTGQMLHAFCIDGYRLAYGQLELYSVNGISFVEQEVLGLSGNHNLTALSVANFNNSLIFVAVVDGGIIKIGAYELTSAAWSSEGFVAMPQEDGENYEKVKIAVSGRYVYVVAKGTDGLIGAMFDVFSRSWNKKKIQFADIAQDIYQFDISVYNRVMIITATTYNQANGGECGNVLVYFWNPDTVTVGNLGVNVAEQQVLETYNAAISSFGSAVIANELHCVMLKDTDAVDVVYDISYNGTSYQAVLKREDKIQQLNQNREIGSFVLHSDGNQIYLVLSGSTILKVSNSQE